MYSTWGLNGLKWNIVGGNSEKRTPKEGAYFSTVRTCVNLYGVGQKTKVSRDVGKVDSKRKRGGP